MVCRQGNAIMATRKWKNDSDKIRWEAKWRKLFGLTCKIDYLPLSEAILKPVAKKECLNTEKDIKAAFAWFTNMPAKYGEQISEKQYQLPYGKVDKNQMLSLWGKCGKPKVFNLNQLQKLI